MTFILTVNRFVYPSPSRSSLSSCRNSTSKASPPAPTRADRQDNTDQEGLLQRFPRCDAEMYQAGKAARSVTSRPTHDDLPLPFGWKAEWQGEICCPDFMRHKPSAAAAPRHGSLQRGHSCPTPAVSCVAVQASADNTAHRTVPDGLGKFLCNSAFFVIKYKKNEWLALWVLPATAQ